MGKQYLDLDVNISKQKPKTVGKNNIECPFCNGRAENSNVLIEKEGKISLIENKFPDLKGVYRTVLIENNECGYDLSNYEKVHLYELINFGLRKWTEMKSSNKYRSVAFFKNHGEFSGASIQHPHMQIVGFYDLNCYEDLEQDDYKGINIYKNSGFELNISTKPKTDFYEFNLFLKDYSHEKEFADGIQNIICYIKKNIIKATDSFNIIFCEINNEIIAKIIPRKATSILLLGYNISQVPNNLAEIADEIKNMYYS